MKKTPVFLGIFFVLFFLLTGCSSDRTNPVGVSGNPDESPVSGALSSGRTILGSWTAEFDIESMTFEVTTDRKPESHWNLTTLLPNPSLSIISYDPVNGILEVDVTIKNPYSLDGYDLRLIIFTDSIGSRLKNADGWVTLYDTPGGLPINPFKAYAKQVSNRKFAALSQHTERLDLYFPSGITYLGFAIDASYPSNCAEPYEINNFSQDVLLDQPGATARINVDVLDWQGNVNSVMIYCPAITGVTTVPLSQKSSIRWSVDLINSTSASAGIYPAYFIATSTGAGTLSMYQKVDIVVSEYSESGWVKTWGSGLVDTAYDLAIDSDGKILVSGRYGDTIDLDPGDGELIFESVMGADVSISKFNSDGELEWGDGWNVLCYHNACPVAVDSSNDVYVIGSEVSIRKYSATGAKQWTRALPDLYASYALEVSPSGLPHFCGDFIGEADFDPSIDEHIINSFNNTYDSYTNVLNSNGLYQRTITFRSLDDGASTALAFDDFESCLIAGFFQGTTDFDSSTNNYWRNSYGSIIRMSDAYLAKYDSSGNFQYVLTWGGMGTENPTDVAAGNGGKIYVSGTFFDSVDFNPDPSEEFYLTTQGGYDAYLSIFDSSGDFITTLVMGGTENDYVEGIAIDNNGNIYLTGYFYGTVDLNPGTGQDLFTSNGGTDIYIVKLDKNNNFVWARTFGSTENDEGYDIAVDKDGNIYVAGGFRGKSISIRELMWIRIHHPVITMHSC